MDFTPAGTMDVARSSRVDPRDLLAAVRMLAAAFPRASWKSDSEAVYVMALTQAHIPADVARRAIATLITEEMQLPPVALVLRRCRETQAGHEFFDWRCPVCGSDKVAGIVDGPGFCGDCDCDWSGTLTEGNGGQ